MQKQIQEKNCEILSSYKPSICLNCSLVLTFLLLFQVSFSQYNLNGIEAVLTRNKQALGGKAVVLVSKDGKIIYQKEIGEDFKPETPAPIGTSSKWLTAALVMTFVDKGELSLDDPVSKYLPVFSSYSKGYITIRQCLSETTGIESEQKKVSRMVQKNKFESLEEEVNYFAAHKDIVVNPGKEFYYGETGYNIAGRVLEVVSKRKTFSKLMQERITRPLTMRKTNFANESGEGAENPASGAVSTAGDYIKFMTMLLNGGQFNGKQILSKESVEELEKISAAGVPVKSAPKTTQGLSYGLGTWISESDKSGKSSVISAPGTNGTWPFIDRCRNYAAVIFTGQLPAEQKRDVFTAVKEEIDQQIKSGCQ